LQKDTLLLLYLTNLFATRFNLQRHCQAELRHKQELHAHLQICIGGKIWWLRTKRAGIFAEMFTQINAV